MLIAATTLFCQCRNILFLHQCFAIIECQLIFKSCFLSWNAANYQNIEIFNLGFCLNCSQQQINNLLTIHTRWPVRGFILAAILAVEGVPEMGNLMHLKQKIITLTCVHRRQICCSLQRYTCSWDGHHGVVDLWSCSLAKSTFSLEVVRGQLGSGPLNMQLKK